MSNGTAVSVNWSVNEPAWLDASVTGGVLAAGAVTSVNLDIAPAAGLLSPGNYAANIVFDDLTHGAMVARSASLTVFNPAGLFEDAEAPGAAWTTGGLWHRVHSTSTCATVRNGDYAWYYGDDATCSYDVGDTFGSLTSPAFTVPGFG